MQPAIGRVRARGSARSGVGHWKAQRLTAIASLLLVLWFTLVAIGMAGSGHGEWVSWFQSPTNAALMILLVLSTFYHAKLGLQVVIEDYVQSETIKVASLIAVTFVLAVLATICIVSVLTLAAGG